MQHEKKTNSGARNEEAPSGESGEDERAGAGIILRVMPITVRAPIFPDHVPLGDVDLFGIVMRDGRPIREWYIAELSVEVESLRRPVRHILTWFHTLGGLVAGAGQD